MADESSRDVAERAAGVLAPESDLFEDLVGAAAVEPDVARKAELALGVALDALSPTNFLATNPAALKKAFDTAGGSVAKGLSNFLDDLANNEGRPRQVDTSGFT